MLTDGQLRAVRYYIGDVSGNDAFWGDGRAYVGLNALFFPGIGTEKLRAAEGKFLNPALLEDTDRLTKLLTDLLSSFRRDMVAKSVTTCRVERSADYRFMEEQGKTISFTSTSTAGFLRSYTDRRGIVLMRFSLSPDTPCLDVSKVLPYYAKPEEAEILLPPGLDLVIREIPLAPEELSMTDSDGLPPQLSVMVIPRQGEPQESAPVLLPSGGSQAGMRVYKALNEGRTPSHEDIVLFSEWKAAFRNMLLGQ